MFDTGSSDIWIPGYSCNICGEHHRKFNEKRSKSFHGIESEQFTITYGNGPVSGFTTTETVTFGNYHLNNVKIGLAAFESEDILKLANDGVCGMAFGALALITQPPMTYLISMKS